MEKWIVTCNLAQYNVFSAVENDVTMYWPQSVNMQKGDLVYMYLSHPYHRLIFETMIIESNVPYVEHIDETIVIDREHFMQSAPFVRLEVQTIFDDQRLQYRELEENGLNTVRRPSIVQQQFDLYLTKIRSDFLAKQELLSQAEYLYEVNESFKEGFIADACYTPHPVDVPEMVWTFGRKSYPRNPLVAVRALQQAKGRCDINPNHHTFMRPGEAVSYTKPVHLIPMTVQQHFLHSLDVEANIASLCSDCYERLQHDENRLELVRQLYQLKIEELEKAGIGIAENDLLLFYQ